MCVPMYVGYTNGMVGTQTADILHMYAIFFLLETASSMDHQIQLSTTQAGIWKILLTRFKGTMWNENPAIIDFFFVKLYPHLNIINNTGIYLMNPVNNCVCMFM